MKATGLAVLAVIAVVVTSIVLAVGHYAFSWWAAPYQGSLQARQQILGSGDFRIQAYDHFFSLCASIQTSEQAMQQTQTQEKTDKGGDLSRDKINFGAQLNNRNDAANQYNVESTEHWTVGQFKANSLPYTIPAYKKGVTTQCASS